MTTQTKPSGYIGYDAMIKTVAFAQSMAPSGAVQQSFDNLFYNMKLEKATYLEITIKVVQMLAEGLAYDQWPVIARKDNPNER